MNPRNLLITGVIILSLVGVIFFLLSDESGPPNVVDSVGAGDNGEFVTGSSAAAEEGSEDSSGNSDGSGSITGGSRVGNDGRSGTDATGRRFRDESESGRSNNGGSSRTNRPTESDNSIDDRNGSDPTSNRRGNSRSGRSGRGSRSGSSDSGRAPEGMVRVTGQIAVEDDPTAGSNLTGQLQIGVSGESRSISVAGGRFVTNIPEQSSIRFFSAVLAGKPARVISPTTAVPARSSASLRVVVRYDSLAILHLLSAETGESLTNVEVLRAKDYTRSSLAHPGWALAQDSQIQSEESPVALDGRIGLIGSAVAIHARAAGYEWKRVTVDLVDGGERELTLERSGAINFHFIGDAEREGVMLRLREVGHSGAPHMEVPVSAGTTELADGILPGTWVASLEVGHWAHQPEVLDEFEIEIVAGDLIEMELEIPIDDEERVEVSGSVFVPSGWFLDFFSVRLRPTGPGSDPVNDTVEIHSSNMTSEDAGGGTLWYWGPVLVKQGNYGIMVLPVGYGDLFEIGEEGLPDVYLELPMPVDISVQTMLADGSGVATPNLIRWAPVQPPGVPGSGAVPVGPGDNGYFELQVPLGSVMLSCSDIAYRPKHQIEEVTAGGENAFTMFLEPAMGMLLFLEEEGTSVPWDLEWHPTVQAQGHNGSVVTRGRTGVGYRLLVSQPGLYSVTIPDLPDFLPVSPFQLDVPPGEVIETVVEIQAE